MAVPRKLIEKIYDIKAHFGKVTSLDIGETGRVLVTGGQDRNVNLWAIGQKECFMSLTGHNRPIECVRFAYNDDFVYSADDTGVMRQWDLNAQSTCSTFNGHMKSVRTLDFQPTGQHIISGSNDTTVRLWDTRNHNKCVRIYRGHVGHVNSVKFSPDNMWIASGGTEGSVIIWDIRKNKQILNFTEPNSAAITCMQFHPCDLLLAVGRINGTISIYDLEYRELKSHTNTIRHSIKCITFSENGKCLIVGTAEGIFVIGVETHFKQFDYLNSTWSDLSDMKLVKQKLICGCYEDDSVTINAVSINRLRPFYNPSNETSVINHKPIPRKTFLHDNQQLYSITNLKPSHLTEANDDNKNSSLDEHSSANISLELFDDSIDLSNAAHPINGFSNGSHNTNITYNILDVPENTIIPPINHISTIASMSRSNEFINFDGPSSLKMPGEIYQFERPLQPYPNDFEYNLNDSNPPVIRNYDHTEMIEDFPVNQNIHQQTNGTNSVNTIGMSSHLIPKITKPKLTSSYIQKRSSQMTSTKSNNATLQHRNKLSQVSSVSTTELHKLDNNMLLKKSASSHFVVKKGKQSLEPPSNLNKENARNKNVSVQIFAKPPTRSRTSFDLRASSKASIQSQSYLPVTTYRLDSLPQTLSGNNQRSFNNHSSDNGPEVHLLMAGHEKIYQELCNRHTTLQLIRNAVRSHDIIGALKHTIKVADRTVFVDLLGAILEKTSMWNLDLCLLLLPEIYQLLQSDHKFHFTRACDALRVILSNFLPIIQENIDPWSASGLGVDVTREERQRKCLECQRWLLQIRNISENNSFGSTTLKQLQNMIVNI